MVILQEDSYLCYELSSLEVASTSHKKRPVRPSQKGFTIQTNPVNKDHHTNSKLVLSILVSGREDSVTDLENRPGLMVLNMQENGEKIELMAKVDLSMLTETFMMVTGPTIRLMVVESISMSMAPSTKDSGKMICNTDMESKHGLTNQSMKEIMHSEESTALEVTSGMMDQCIQVTGERTRYLA